MAVCAGILTIALSAMLWIASSAKASEVIYWENYKDNTIAYANIDGSGGGLLNLTGITLNDPEGMAYDPVTNRLFVANSNGGPTGDGQIVFVNLDGSGAGVLNTPGVTIDSPDAIALDPATRMLYWTNFTSPESIGWARLDGSAAGTLNTTGTTVEDIYKLALDPASGRVFWSNEPGGSSPETINFANANNTGGGGSLNLSGASVPEGITGMAVDTVSSRLYWLDQDRKGVSSVALGGGSGSDLNIFGAAFNSPYGLAVDPSLGRAYWANYGLSTERNGAIGFASLSGGGGGINFATVPINGTQDPVILKSPSGTGAPAATRSTKSRSSLACSTGNWAVDYPGSYVYQSPRSYAYQWTRNGTAIAGATAATFSAKSAGSYVCTVTATNQTGSSSQASAAVKVNAAKIKLTVKKKVTVKAGGVAKFKVKAVNQGDLQTKKAKVCVKVPKNAKADLKAPKCKTLGKLKGRGKKGGPLTIKVGKEAKGTYKVTFALKGAPGKPAKAKIQVK
jgi:hypothetical protein